ncbi:ABC transporter permease [Tsukamurella tyrosinosolvens]|uniref:Phospholipid/cholesterol/gamma-HCH transport system permease protein n=1 Tax=Tsukamurella tyrosinosolvens TaxID=57704 RepID=A0A1H4SL08_TSUTY|nr:ABC transporter permease [Tsukamurella tyrosinosolvens]KXO93434.1 ABC transporter permease [Tsukamurella tyrosinosolvens]SEC44885.1 phospholipid/cholesterol/gamma-HCH transport system permease protein [Tsukamurella tyrosinosolvens]
MSIATYRPPGTRTIARVLSLVRSLLSRTGHVMSFSISAVAMTPHAARHYSRQTISTVTDLTWGRGAVIVGGGTSLVTMVLGLAMGGTVAVQAFATLNLLGLGSLTGSVSALAITREFAPLLAAAAFAGQAGCRMTAEIGAMRINEEIDAIESLGLRSISFVVSTRVLAGLIAVMPTFLIAIVVSFFACNMIVTVVQGESEGTYNHYFRQFLTGADVLAAMIKVIIFLVVVILIHCYQGFFAAGGPEGVGVASGRAVRASLVFIVVLDMILTTVTWGFNSSVVFRG